MINNSTLLELLARDAMSAQRHSERLPGQPIPANSAPAARQQPAGSVRSTMASYLVRLGLRLDPAAGGDLGQPLSTGAAQREAGRCA